VALVLLHDHIVDELIGQLSQDFQCQFTLTKLCEIIILNELYDITDGFIALGISQFFIIGIENLHLYKVAITNADNDSTEGHRGESDQACSRFIHIVAVSISDDDHNMIEPITIHACLVQILNDLVLHGLEQVAKVAGPGKRRPNDTLFVSI